MDEMIQRNMTQADPENEIYQLNKLQVKDFSFLYHLTVQKSSFPLGRISFLWSYDCISI